MVSKRERSSHQKVAQEHVAELHKMQKEHLHTDRARAQRYTDLIRRISMKFRMRLPREVKRSYCKHCKTVLVPSQNCRVRVQNGKVVYTCFTCKKFTRIPINKKNN